MQQPFDSKNCQSFNSLTLSLVPQDLTGKVTKCDDQYCAGGSFGDVYRCKYHDTDCGVKEVAVKTFRFEFTVTDENGRGDRCTRMIRRELGIWRRLNHPNIVPFLGIASGFGRLGNTSLVSEWMSNGTLQNFLQKYGSQLTVAHRLRLLLDAANGLEYLHSLSIVHGDLTPGNVLLDNNYTARLTDFGYASLVGEVSEALAYLQASTLRSGAVRWTAPECVSPHSEEEKSYCTTKSDIYSFGSVALQVLSGERPWSEISRDEAIIIQLFRGHQPRRPSSRPIDDQHWVFIEKCWSIVGERPSAEHLVSSIQDFLLVYPITQSFCDLLEDLHKPEKLRFRSSSWRHNQSLDESIQSPPREVPCRPPSLSSQEMTMTNAAGGDGGFVSSGPQLHVNSATPVSDDGATLHTKIGQQSTATLPVSLNKVLPQQHLHNAGPSQSSLNLTNPPLPQSRAAAEAQAISSSTSSGVLVAPAPKKRKRDQADDPHGTIVKEVAPGHHQQLALPSTKSWVSGSGLANTDSSNDIVPCDDKKGHYIIVPDDIIYNRYRTVRLLGRGTFGKVVEAVDVQTQNRVAIKIIRAIPKYRNASKIEIRVLQKLKERDPANVHKCIHLLHWFDHRNHICLVSELLGMCVYDFLKENEFAPFPRNHIQSFARQLLGSVAFLHDLHLIHTDLKPQNILLVHNDYRLTVVPVPGERISPPQVKRILQSTDIRLIDFGSATFEEEYHPTAVSMRHYRAPEIILGYSTLALLFQTHDNLEHLTMMEAVMGKMHDRFARAGARSKPEFFKEGPRLDWPKPDTSRQRKKNVRATRSLVDVIPPNDQVSKHFLDLVRRLLAFDPAQRITVREALHHPYLSVNVSEEL